MAKVKRYKEDKKTGKLTQVDSISGKPLSSTQKGEPPKTPIVYLGTDNPDGTFSGSVDYYENDDPSKPVRKDFSSKEEHSSFSPTVFSSAGISDNLIPQMNMRASSFGSGMPTFTGSPDAGQLDAGYVGGDEGLSSDYDLDSILGTDKKKKKKNIDLDYWKNFESQPGMAMPSGYWEQAYGANAPAMRALSDAKRVSDRYFRAQLDTVENKYNQLEQMQQTANTQNLAQVRNALLGAGSSRYAPLSSAGIEATQQSFGIQKLADLANQEALAVSQIKEAQANQDYELMEKKFDVLDGIRSEKEKAVEDAMGNLDQSIRDTQLADLVAQGISDPIELLQTLNARGGNYTLEEISGALKNLGTRGGGAFSFDAKQTGPLLGAGFSMMDIEAMQNDLNNGASINEILAGVPGEMAMAVRNALGIPAGTDTSGLTPGVGAKDSDSEYVIRQRLFTNLKNQMFGKNSSDKEAEMLNGMIANLRGLGMAPQDIINQLTGFTPGIESPYNDTFASIVRANSEDPAEISSALQSLSSLIDAKDFKRAMQKVENIGMRNASKLDPDGYMGDATAKTMLENARKLEDAIAQAESYIGPFSGSFQQMLGKLKSGEAAKLKAQIVTLTAQFRNQLSGTAVTESEAKFLEPLIASITDTETNFKAKLQELQRGTLNRLNKTREVGSLPPVSIQEALYPAQRLYLYADRITSDDITSPEI